MKKITTGKVYLVGAGPGDAGLMTQRGAALVAQADCIIYDRLVNKELFWKAKKGCEKIYVGKTFDEEGESQGRINQLLVRKARQYRRVVRLKGGEPTLFGRISEELETLSREKIPFEIISGVSSAWAAAAAAGIPLTDRRYSSSVAIVTGQEARGKPETVRWKELARAVDTIVIVMGAHTLPSIVKKIQRAGRPSTTPITLIRWATLPQQEIVRSTLGQILNEIRKRPHFGPPFIAVVGEVVRLGQQFQSMPLKGKKILVTRAAEDSAEVTRQLENLGAECFHLPTVQIRPRVFSKRKVREIAHKLPQYQWIIFPSRYGVQALHQLARTAGFSLASLVKGKCCAVGPKTADALRHVGLRVDLLPKDFSSAGLQEFFLTSRVRGKNIFIPRSNLGMGNALAEKLRRKGALVDEVILYWTIHPRVSSRLVQNAVGDLDAATFTSASTVKGFTQALALAKIPLLKALNGARVVAIGPSTAQALKEIGVEKVFVPKISGTVGGLVQTVREVLEK